MINLISSIIPFIVAIFVFGILVTVHEFGHFIVAKKGGIFVEEFAIGMGPLIFKKQIGETLYSLRALPIGGFCKMLGEDESCNDKRAFNNKNVFIRIAVVVAGPFMNFILAFLITFAIIGSVGFTETVVDSVNENSPALKAGLQKGDRVVAINGEKVNIYDDFKMVMYKNMGEAVDITIKRDSETITYNINPEYSKKSGGYIFGFMPQHKNGMFGKDINKAGILESIKNSYYTMFFYIKATISGFVDMVTLKVSREEITGPIGIVKLVGDSYEVGIKTSVADAVLNIANIAAILSVNLGALNLFPIPALDGGRLVFLIIEAIRKKPLNREKEGLVHFLGFTLLMAFMCFVAYNDIVRIFLK